MCIIVVFSRADPEIEQQQGYCLEASVGG
jgi:hypothetical protein